MKRPSVALKRLIAKIKKKGIRLERGTDSGYQELLSLSLYSDKATEADLATPRVPCQNEDFDPPLRKTETNNCFPLAINLAGHGNWNPTAMMYIQNCRRNAHRDGERLAFEYFRDCGMRIADHVPLVAVDMLGIWQWIELNTVLISNRDMICSWVEEPYLILPTLIGRDVKTLLMVTEFPDWSEEAAFPVHCFVAMGTLREGWVLRNPGGFREPITSDKSVSLFKDARQVRWVQMELTGEPTLNYLTRESQVPDEDMVIK